LRASNWCENSAYGSPAAIPFGVAFALVPPRTRREPETDSRRQSRRASLSIATINGQIAPRKPQEKPKTVTRVPCFITKRQSDIRDIEAAPGSSGLRALCDIVGAVMIAMGYFAVHVITAVGTTVRGNAKSQEGTRCG